MRSGAVLLRARVATPTRRDGQRYTFLPANPSKMYTFLRGSPSKTYTYAPALLEGQTHRRTLFWQVDVARRRVPGGRSDVNPPKRDPVRCLLAANCRETPHLVLAVDRNTDPGLISTPCSPPSPRGDWRGFLSGTPLAPIVHVFVDYQNGPFRESRVRLARVHGCSSLWLQRPV